MMGGLCKWTIIIHSSGNLLKIQSSWYNCFISITTKNSSATKRLNNFQEELVLR